MICAYLCVFRVFCVYSVCACTRLGKRVGPRLRELIPAARGSQEAEFTQPRDHTLAHPCILLKRTVQFRKGEQKFSREYGEDDYFSLLTINISIWYPHESWVGQDIGGTVVVQADLGPVDGVPHGPRFQGLGRGRGLWTGRDIAGVSADGDFRL